MIRRQVVDGCPGRRSKGAHESKGTNRVVIQRASDHSAMQTNVITSYYIPWSESEATQAENFTSGDTRGLKLKVEFEQREAKVGQTIVCRVEAERVGFAGYGMVLTATKCNQTGLCFTSGLVRKGVSSSLYSALASA